MRKVFNLGKCLLLLVVTVAIIAVGALIGQALMFGATAISIAAPPIIMDGAATVDKGDTLGGDLNMDYVSKKITEMRPASTPLHTLMSNVSKVVPVDSFKTEFYAVDIKPFNDTATAAFTNTGVQTAGEITVGNVAIWNIDDTVLIPGVLGGDGKPLMGCVTSKNVGSNKITIQAMNGTGAGTAVVPNVAINSVLVRMGTAKSEMDMQTGSFTLLPEKDFNYCQNFMAQIEASTFDKIQAKEVDWDFSDYEELSIYDMKAAMERNYLFGIRKKFNDATDSEVKYTCGGVNSFLTKGLTWSKGGGITSANWIDWAKSIFQDNAGSDNRIALIGDDLMAAIAKVGAVEKQLEAKNTEVKFGITFSVVETNWGKIYFKRHPMFRLMGMSENGFVLDINNIQKHVHVPMKSTKLDLITSGQRNADATVIQEVSCPVVTYGATHTRITPVA